MTKRYEAGVYVSQTEPASLELKVKYNGVVILEKTAPENDPIGTSFLWLRAELERAYKLGYTDGKESEISELTNYVEEANERLLRERGR